jgi:hypothetical protein
LPVVAMVFGGQDPKRTELKRQFDVALMRSKLEHSKIILGGLATEDFTAIGNAAQAMKGLTVLEHWFRAESPQYKAQLNVFWFANDALIQAANEKNLDSAALAYTQLTLSCVNCHKHVRSELRAQ